MPDALHQTPSLRYASGWSTSSLAAYDDDQVVRHDSSALELDAVEATGRPAIHVLRPLLDPAA